MGVPYPPERVPRYDVADKVTDHSDKHHSDRNDHVINHRDSYIRVQHN